MKWSEISERSVQKVRKTTGLKAKVSFVSGVD